MRTVAIATFLCLLCISLHAQQLTKTWAVTAGGTGHDQGVTLAPDQHGFIYVAGSFTSSSMTIGNTMLTNAGGTDIFLVKYDTAGNFVWARAVGGTGNEKPVKLTIARDGAVYLTGSYTAGLSFDSHQLTGGGNFLAKLTNTGNALWLRNVTATSVATDSRSYIYVGGYTVSKYHPDGTLLFNRTVPGMGTGGPAPVVAVDKLDNFYSSNYNSQTWQTRTWWDSSGVLLGNQSFTNQVRYYGSGFKPYSPTNYYYSSEFIGLSGISSTVYFGHNSSDSRINGCYKNCINIDVDELGNQFTAGYVAGTDVVCGSGQAALTAVLPTQTLTGTTGYDIYFVSRTDNGITALGSTRENGNTSETPQELALDTVGRALYIVGSWQKRAANANFTFGSSVLTNSGAVETNDALLLKISYSVSALNVSAGSDLAVCYGGKAQLNAAVSGGGGNYTYSWTPSAGLSNASIPNPVAQTLVDRDFVLTVTDGAGVARSDTIHIAVNPDLYKPTITYENTPRAFCEGQTTSLVTAQAISYQWSNGGTSFYIPVSAEGKYAVTTVNAAGCIGKSDTFQVTLKPRPQAPTIQYTGTATICPSGSKTLIAETDQTPPNFTWSNGVTTASLNVINPGIYAVFVTGINGCPSTTASVMVTAAQSPTGTVNAAGSSFCQGDSTLLTLTTPSSNGFVWSTGATTPAVWVKTAGNYSAALTSQDGCSGTTNTVAVTSLPTPATPAISASGPVIFCEGNSVVLNAQSAGGPGYLWSTGATTASLSVNTSGNYTVRAIGSNGCKSAVASQTVTVNPLPVGGITANGPLSFCAGDSVRLTASVASPSGFVWSNGSGSQVLTVKTAGSYHLQLTSSAGCVRNSNTLTTTVFPGIAYAVDQVGNTLSVSPAGDSYQWYFENVPVSGANAQTFTMTQGGSYLVKVTSSNGCTGIGIYSAVYRALSRDIYYQVYPNPSAGDLNIVYRLQTPEVVTITIQSMTGQNLLVLEENKLQQPGEHWYAVRKGKLLKGYYILRVTTGKKTIVQKLLVI